MKTKLKIFGIGFFIVSAFNTNAQLVVSTAPTPQQLVENFLIGADSVFNITYSGNLQAIGSFTNGYTTNLGLNEGICLSSGDIINIPAPASNFASTDMAVGSDPDLQALIPSYTIYDASVLEFDFIPSGNLFVLRYVFGSEEYPEYVSSSFNDVFGLFVSGQGLNGPFTNNAVNIALIPGTALPVSIDNINNVTPSYQQYYVDNQVIGGTTIVYDGFTTVLTAMCAVTPGENYHIKIAIGDAGDGVFDSGVFLEAKNLNVISGNIFQDLNLNCISDSGENKLSNWLVEIDPGPFYVTTNPNGLYAILVDTGTYTVMQYTPNNLWGLECPVSPDYYTVNFTSTYDTSYSNDFAIKADVLCALLNVDISTWALRPCMDSYYAVSYCNNGTIPANNVYIEVEFDSVVTPTGSTLPWSSQNGNVYTFNIGTLSLFQCGSFQITAAVSCYAVMGSTHCIEARIYPDTLCFPPDTAWDHSSVAVEGECLYDSLACFTVYNTGDPVTGDMDGPSEYRIYENNVLVYTGQFQLAGGDSIIICWPTNGNAIRLEADQRPGHPGNSHPQETIENCGDSTGASFGQIIVVPEDDIDANVEIDCREITGSVDPNEKLVKPTGLTELHYIDPTTILEYQINFQNTGTDTAFKVIIMDTLSEYLDISTVETGAGSHSYTFKIFGQGILELTLDSILLPAANVNEPGSHGFVKFKVHQIDDNPKGTLIENRAGIIFDFNAPVITETVWNIVNDIDTMTSIEAVVYNNSIEVKVFPNPFNDYTTFVITGMNKNEQYSIILYDLMGKTVKRINNIQSNIFNFRKDKLPSGMYFYKLHNGKEDIAMGKIIIN
ncbi:MAG: choice-of-anchor L domain-containing protein [Bacteroidota bacterium]